MLNYWLLSAFHKNYFKKFFIIFYEKTDYKQLIELFYCVENETNNLSANVYIAESILKVLAQSGK